MISSILYAFRHAFAGKEMVDYIADYLENIRDRRVFPDVKPGYMRELVPDSAPVEGENWENIFKDVEGVIMPGVSKNLPLHKYLVRGNIGLYLLI